MPPDVPVCDQASSEQSLSTVPLAAERTEGGVLTLGRVATRNSETTAAPNPPVPTDDWVRDHYGQIHRAAWMMTGDAWAAEDLAQETFVVAIDKWDRFDERSSRSTWLYGILIRLHQRHRRTLSRLARRLKNYAFQNESQQHHKELHSDPATKLATESWRQSVWADVARLPGAQCEAITLRYAQDLSYEEIALAIGCPVGTVKTRVHHGLKRLKQSQTVRNDLTESLDEVEPSASE